MDVLKMTYPDSSFDIVLDKGTMDALFVDKDPWEQYDPEIAQMCHEISRVIRPGGLYVMITFDQPHFRKPHLLRQEYQWTLEDLLTIGESFPYFMYILRKEIKQPQ